MASREWLSVKMSRISSITYKSAKDPSNAALTTRRGQGRLLLLLTNWL